MNSHGFSTEFPFTTTHTFSIKSFKHRAQADLFQTGKTAKIDAKMHKRILVLLDRLEVSEKPDDMNMPGFAFHSLKGFNPTR